MYKCGILQKYVRLSSQVVLVMSFTQLLMHKLRDQATTSLGARSYDKAHCSEDDKHSRCLIGSALNPTGAL